METLTAEYNEKRWLPEGPPVDFKDWTKVSQRAVYPQVLRIAQHETRTLMFAFRPGFQVDWNGKRASRGTLTRDKLLSKSKEYKSALGYEKFYIFFAEQERLRRRRPFVGLAALTSEHPCIPDWSHALL